MKVFGWKELVQLAKERSPYYGRLYASVNGFGALHELPIVDQDEYWSANTIQNNRLLTAELSDGIVFKSGGTTGHPKFSAYTKDEWDAFTRIFGEGLCKAGLAAGDRVANLFYAGELYASFIFIMKSLEAAAVPALQFPIGGATSSETIIKTVDDFAINVLAGAPTTIMQVAEYYAQHRAKYSHVSIEKIFFGGESMYPDQRDRLQGIFPGVNVSSIGYASVDAGLLGYADATCGFDEHRVFGSATIFEIVDEETGALITDMDRPGKVLITNLTRSLNPIIRYPAGDRAVWKEPASPDNPDRKFLILGRSEEAARVGPVSIYYDDVRGFLTDARLGCQITAFQLVTRHFDMKDALVIRLSTSSGEADCKRLSQRLVNLFHSQRPMFAHAVEQSIIHPLAVEWVEPPELAINPRSGKLRRVIDHRS